MVIDPSASARVRFCVRGDRLCVFDCDARSSKAGLRPDSETKRCDRTISDWLRPSRKNANVRIRFRCSTGERFARLRCGTDGTRPVAFHLQKLSRKNGFPFQCSRCFSRGRIQGDLHGNRLARCTRDGRYSQRLPIERQGTEQQPDDAQRH